MANKISLGLDLSLTGTGVVVFIKGKPIIQKLIKSKPAGDKPIDELKRIQQIVKEIEEILLKLGSEDKTPDIANIEGLAFMAKGTSLVQLSALNYFTRALLSSWHIPFLITAPTTLKKFGSGKGNTDKEVLMMMIYRDYKFQILDNNVVDACILALIGAAVMGDPVKKLTVPQQEVVALISKQL